MKKFVTVLAVASSFAALTAAVPAAAATTRHHTERSYQAPADGPGYYEGDYQLRVDKNDRASSPYAGGVG